MAFQPKNHRISSALAVLIAATTLLLTFAGIAGASGPDGQVRGFVKDSGSSAPVQGAVVKIAASDLPWVFETTTDPTGYFAIAVPPHRYDVSATSPAYLQSQITVALGSGATTWANLTLAPAAGRTSRLQGYVTDSLSGFPVTVGRIAAGPPSGFAGYRNSSSLNTSGYYAMSLVPASYQVTTDGVRGYGPFSFYPISVIAGQTRWYNFTLNPNRVNAWINGTTRDADTRAVIAGAMVTARVDGILFGPVTSSASGVYSIQIQSGSVVIAADAAGHVPISTTVSVSGSSTYYLDLYLPPLSHSVRGFVTDGVTGARLRGLLVTLTPLWSTGYYDQATTNASGYYNIPFPNDDFIVSTRATGYTSWSTWAFSFSGPIVWANATLWPIISTVAGYIIDGSNGSRVPGLLVNAIDSRSSYFASGSSDATGFFSFLVPVSPAISVVVYSQGPYSGDIEYVGTRPYKTTWVNITLQRSSAQILANVTNALTGSPVSGANAIAAWFYGSSSGATNASGLVRLSAPAGVQVYITVLATGYLTWTDVLAPAAGLNTISIRLYPDLPKDVRIRGYVRDAGSGSGLWPAIVEATGYDGLVVTGYTDSLGYYEFFTVARPQTVRATASGYAAARASVNPAAGTTIWVNLTLAQDLNPPRIRSFTATPSTRVSVSNPTALVAAINETRLERADISILMQYSASAGIGTFLNLGRLNAANVSVSMPTPGNYTVASSWNTRTQVGRLTDGLGSVWWPTLLGFGPFFGVVGGYWDNGTLPSPAAGSAVFDIRDGRLLFVITASGFVGPLDQPASTFTPSAGGLRVDLTTAAIVGGSLVRGPALRLGGLRMALSSVVPSGRYGALLEAWDSARNYAPAVALMDTGPDTIPPVANAGPDITAPEGTTVTFDGSASTDNIGIVSYTWTFTDGIPRTLTGVTASYVFATPGTYVVTLTVRDAAGNTGTDSLIVTVRDVTRPTVSISSPSEGSTVYSPVTVTATAADNVGVVRVEFFVDGVSVGNDTVAPFELTIPGGIAGAGNHTIKVVAYDAAGNSASDLRHVTVSNSPGGPFGSGPILFLFALVGVIVAVGVALILLRRRRPPPPVQAPPRIEPSSVSPAPGLDPAAPNSIG